MTPRVRTAIQRIEQAFEAQNWGHPTLLTDAHELAQYAKQAHATIGGGDTAISQLQQEADVYRRERDAAHHVIIEAGIVPVEDTHCDCDECKSVLEGMQKAGYA